LSKKYAKLGIARATAVREKKGGGAYDQILDCFKTVLWANRGPRKSAGNGPQIQKQSGPLRPKNTSLAKSKRCKSSNAPPKWPGAIFNMEESKPTFTVLRKRTLSRIRPNKHNVV